MSAHPNCCDDAAQYRTVSLFVPREKRPAHWAVPVIDDEGKPVPKLVTTMLIRLTPTT